MRALLPAAPSVRTSRYWFASGWWGDQGETPECVAYAWAHWLEDGPVTQKAGPPPIVDPETLYREARGLDEWPGDDYEGTSVRGGAKAVQTRGYISAYHWAADLDDIVQALLEVGPVVVGTSWYDGMFEPDAMGLLSVSGSVAGGHAYVLDGVSVPHQLVRLKNSWGRGWGHNGFAFLRFDDLARLLREDGEGCLATEVRRR